MGNEINLIGKPKGDNFVLEIDGMSYRKFFDKYGEAGAKSAVRAVNFGGERARVAVTRSIRTYTGIKLKDLKTEVLVKRRATKNNLSYMYRLSKKGVPLDSVAHKKSGNGFQTGAKISPHREFKSSFKIGGAGSFSGKIAVRKGKARYPIQRVSTGSISMSAAQHRGIHSWGAERISKEFVRQMKLYSEGKIT